MNPVDFSASRFLGVDATGSDVIERINMWDLRTPRRTARPGAGV